MSEQSVGKVGLPIAGNIPRLRADWRGEYITAATETERLDNAKGMRAGDGERCVFCRILSMEASPANDEANFIVHRSEHCIVILNAYPYTSGHCMVMPVRHAGTLLELKAEEAAELWEFVTHATGALSVAYAPEGINVGANLGRAAGAGIPGHLHVHLVPRWSGDTNFMTTIAETRVVPESLSTTWRKLHIAW